MSVHPLRRMAAAAGAVVSASVVGYAVLAGLAWRRFGHPPAPSREETDPLLDWFMPDYDVVERHAIHVRAPADVALAAAKQVDLQRAPLVRAIFHAREFALGSAPVLPRRPRGLIEETTALGWGRLVEVPGRELIMGAVTRPWLADVVFRAVPSAAFAAFREPGVVKVVWTIRADPQPDGTSILRTETRAFATDAQARRRFRWYWARFSPGIVLIRLFVLPAARADAERAYGKADAA